MCAAVATFSCLDATGKYLLRYMDPLQVVWARYFGAFLLALIFLNPITTPKLLTTTRPIMQLGRSTLLLVSTALNFFALRYLQLDEALAILFSTPFLVALLCGPLLGEWVGWRRWTAISVGFLGVLLVARPGFGGLHPAALLSLGSAVCYSLYVISTRVLARSDSSETTLFYSNLVGAVAMLPVIPFVWTPPDNAFVMALMVLDRCARQRWALSPHPRPPVGAGIDVGAFHLHANGLDDDAGLPGVRRRAAPVDDRRGTGRDLVRSLSALPRASNRQEHDQRSGDRGSAAIGELRPLPSRR